MATVSATGVREGSGLDGASGIEVLETVAVVGQRPATRRKGRRELQVNLKSNGNGAALDARWVILELPNFQPGDRISHHVGATKAGLWIDSPSEARALAEALSIGADALEAYQELEHGAA